MVPLLFFVGIAGCTAGATLIVRRLMHSRGIVDIPDTHRKRHQYPTPRLGGIAIYLGFVIGTSLVIVFQERLFGVMEVSRSDLLGLLLAGTLVFSLGVYDDLRGANAYKKFTIQGGAALLLYLLGYRMTVLSHPFGGGDGASLVLGWVSFPLTLLWLVGVSNALNLIDGHDGLAGGVAFFTSMTLMFSSGLFGHPVISLLYLLLAAATLGFLPWNRPPASIFMGDVGSLFWGL